VYQTLCESGVGGEDGALGSSTAGGEAPARGLDIWMSKDDILGGEMRQE